MSADWCFFSRRTDMFAARMMTLSALFFVATTPACTQIEHDDDVSSVESEGKARPGSTTTTGPTCSSTTDYMSDANNCGTCGNVCGSGLCYSGVCTDATAGHVFVIGHGYASSNPSLDRVLGNAVFSNDRSTLRIVAYGGQFAQSTMVSGTNAAMDRYATAHGRTIQRTILTSSADVAYNLPNADVFIVYAQTLATSIYLDALGDEWSLRLDQFARGGGTIIVLDAQSENAGTAQVLVRSGLMNLTGRSNMGAVAYCGDAEDIAAARVPLMFAVSGSVGWTPSSWKNVATGEAGQAMVVHRAIY
jgi:hypothetical protein